MGKSENALSAASRPTKPSKREAADAIRSATEYLIATRQAERALKAGNCAPFFRLRDQHGVDVASETLLRRGPLLLTFYTGAWCPACSRDLQAFESLRPFVEARGAYLVSVSQQTVAENAKARAHLKLGFPILSDRGGRLAQLFGVRWCIPELLRDIHRKSGIDLPLLNGDESWTLPIPARFILDRAGVIAYSEINPCQSGHSPVRGVLPVLDHMRSLRAARTAGGGAPGSANQHPGVPTRRLGTSPGARPDPPADSRPVTPAIRERNDQKGFAMIDLFTWPTPNGTKPSIMLEEVGVPYSVHHVNLGSGEQHAPQFLAVSPNAKIPAIVDHDGVGGPRTVFESGAILVYLAEKTGMLLPKSGSRREQVMSWLFWSMSGVGPTFGQLLHFVSAENGSSSAVRRFLGEAVRLVHVLERRLGEAAYLAEEYSIADVGAFTWMNFALPSIRSDSPDALGATPAVDRWLSEINGRPAVRRGLRAPKIVVGRAKPLS